MYTRTLLVLLAICSVALNYEEDGKVLVLKDDDFPQVFEDFPLIMIQFYAPWCGHCKKLAPIYNQIAQEFHDEGVQLRLAKVDSTVEKKAAATYKVRGYPTIFFFSKGEQMDYKGGRTKDVLKNWLLKRTRDPVAYLEQAQYEALPKNKVHIVLHSAEGVDSFSTLALMDDNNLYYRVSGVKEEGTVEIIRPFAETVETKLDDQISQWIEANDRPLIKDFDDRLRTDLVSNSITLAIFFNTKGLESAKTAFEAAAKAYQGNEKIYFSEVKVKEPRYKELSDYMKIKPELYPITILYPADQKKIVLNVVESELTADHINEFLAAFNEKQLTTYGYTDEIPAEEYAGANEDL